MGNQVNVPTLPLDGRFDLMVLLDRVGSERIPTSFAGQNSESSDL